MWEKCEGMGLNGFLGSTWNRQLKFSAYAWFMIFWSLSKFELNKTTFIFYCFLGGTKGKKIKKTIDGLGRDFEFFPLVFKVFYTCVSFWLLTHESHDLSQAETKMGRNLVYCTCCPNKTAHKPVKQSRQQAIRAYCPKIYTLPCSHIRKI